MKPVFAADPFPVNYLESREAFLRQAVARGARLESTVMPDVAGAHGEALAMDFAYLGDDSCRKTLLVTTATHGVEGFCGAGCVSLLLADEDLQTRARQNGVALLLVHGVNPYGFSHLRRVNEDNADLNRNWLDFASGVPANPLYDQLDELLIPKSWPPTAEADARLNEVIAEMGQSDFRRAIATGQYSKPDGLYFGGAAKSWSAVTLFRQLKTMLSTTRSLGWIDVHTGLGPYGHGEKLYVGRADPAEEARARSWWGQDVFSVHRKGAVSGTVSGALAHLVYDLGLSFESTIMALEYGTVGTPSVRAALRGDQWLYRNSDAPAAKAHAIKQALKDAFFCDEPVWKGMVLGQFKVAVIQAIDGLAHQQAAAEPSHLALT
ncbi:M14 family metallopeptidase [Sphingobium boeckii]|uniref:DUF2817 domain-containing protein n=1 Tax=Sphingobium boeckii TaxID=1082345 RepID=A0A7W9EDC2_9SPHN|nr:hypothetical protein [Sphingobium boeckii]